MRLISWNANYNNKRRSFEADLGMLADLNADVIVLSETARPREEISGQVVWIGENQPGLVVVARNGYSLEPSNANTNAPALSGGFKVVGPLAFALLAVWPVKRSDRDSYAQILDCCLGWHSALFDGEPVVMAGDFNSSSRVSEQSRSHPAFVGRVTTLGLTSVYHHQSGEKHGEETKATYRHRGTPPRPFCIDYCFVSHSWAGAASIQILDGSRWLELSDHFPLVLDLPERI